MENKNNLKKNFDTLFCLRDLAYLCLCVRSRLSTKHVGLKRHFIFIYPFHGFLNGLKIALWYRWKRFVHDFRFKVKMSSQTNQNFFWILFYPPASEASREVAIITERKNMHTPVYQGKALLSNALKRLFNDARDVIIVCQSVSLWLTLTPT